MAELDDVAQGQWTRTINTGEEITWKHASGRYTVTITGESPEQPTPIEEESKEIAFTLTVSDWGTDAATDPELAAHIDLSTISSTRTPAEIETDTASIIRADVDISSRDEAITLAINLIETITHNQPQRHPDNQKQHL